MPLSPPQIRRLIDRLVLNDPELDAFLNDYFPDVFRQTSAGMQRTAKVTLLLTYVPETEKIVAALGERFPAAQEPASPMNPSPTVATSSSPPAAGATSTGHSSAAPPASAIPPVNLPASLVAAVRQRRIIPFAGAGVSMAVLDRQHQTGGKPARLFPSWHALLERAAEKLRAEHAEGEAQLVQGSLRLRTPDYLLAAKTAQEGLGPLWYPFLRENFNPSFDRVVPESLALAQSLWRLGSRLIITTNFDRVLRWACPQALRENLRELSNQAAAEQAALLRDGAVDPTIWHLHGSIDNASHIILTPDGYSRLYPDEQSGSVAYQAALQTLRTLFSTHSLLFVGFSFTDAQFGDQLRWIQEVFAGAVGPHYLLIRQAELAVTQARLSAGNVRLELIPYADHGQPLQDLLAALSREVVP